MQLEIKKYLYDIQQAADLIAQFTVGKEFSDYQREPMLRLAVERAFAIIGEALSRLSKLDPSLVTRITAYQRINPHCDERPRTCSARAKANHSVPRVIFFG